MLSQGREMVAAAAEMQRAPQRVETAPVTMNVISQPVQIPTQVVTSYVIQPPVYVQSGPVYSHRPYHGYLSPWPTYGGGGGWGPPSFSVGFRSGGGYRGGANFGGGHFGGRHRGGRR